MSTEATVSGEAFRSTLNSVKKERTWVSPFRKNQGEPKPRPSSGSLNTTASAAKGKEPSEETAATPATHTTATEVKTEIKSKVAVPLSPTAVADGAEKPAAEEVPKKKKVVVDNIIDLGGGLKMPQSKIDAIAKAKLADDFDVINSKAAEQTKLRDLKNAKKAELKALKDQNKVNSTFARFKRKLDLDKKKFNTSHEQQVQELESSIAGLEQQMKDLDNTTVKEIEEAKKNHADHLEAADGELEETKEQIQRDAVATEEEKLTSIKNTQVNQQKQEIATRVLHAKQSEYELSLELLVLQLGQKNRELEKQKTANSEQLSSKQEIESKIEALNATIAENNAKIKRIEEDGLVSTQYLKTAEEELAASKSSLEKVRLELATLRAEKSSRQTRLVDAENKRKEYEEEQERLRKEAQEKAKAEEEERKRKAEAERLRLAKEENARKLEEERLSKEAEEARISKESEELKKKTEENDEKVKSAAIPVATTTAAATPAILSKSADSPAVPVSTNNHDTAPTVSGEKPKKKRLSGLFSFVKKDKDKAGGVKHDSPEKKTEKKSASTGKTVTAVTGGLLATGAAIAGTTIAATATAASGAGNTVKSVSDIPGSQPKSTEALSLPELKENTSAIVAKDAQVLQPDHVEGAEPETVVSPVEEIPTGADISRADEDVTAEVIKQGAEPIIAVKHADEKVTLEEVSPSEAKNESEVIAIAADKDDALQEIDAETAGAAASLITPPSTAEEVDAQRGTYTEPGEIVIPEDQKFSISDKVHIEVPSEKNTLTGSSELISAPTVPVESTRDTTQQQSGQQAAPGTGKNAKKNARKNAKKKAKAAAAAAAAATTAATGAGGIALASSTEITPAPTTESEADLENSESEEVIPPTAPGEQESGSYVEPKPVEIPEEQKFTVVSDADVLERDDLLLSPEDVSGSTTAFTTLDPKHPGEKVKKSDLPSELDVSATPEAQATATSLKTNVETSSSASPKKESFFKKIFKTHSGESSAKVPTTTAVVAGAPAATAHVETAINSASSALVTEEKQAVETIGPDETPAEDTNDDAASLYSIREVVTYEYFTPEEEAALRASVKA